MTLLYISIKNCNNWWIRSYVLARVVLVTTMTMKTVRLEQSFNRGTDVLSFIYLFINERRITKVKLCFSISLINLQLSGIWVSHILNNSYEQCDGISSFMIPIPRFSGLRPNVRLNISMVNIGSKQTNTIILEGKNNNNNNYY